MECPIQILNMKRSERRVQKLPRNTVIAPYIKDLSETVRRSLTPLDIKIVFRSMNTLRSLLVHQKDPVPLNQCKGVVYWIPCAGCPKVYVGQGGRTLKYRLTRASSCTPQWWCNNLINYCRVCSIYQPPCAPVTVIDYWQLTLTCTLLMRIMTR